MGKAIKNGCCILLAMLFIFSSSVNGYAITLEEEENLSKEFLKVIFDHYEIIRDPVFERTLERVTHRILAVLPPQSFRYHFYIVKDREYNAFATPAGHIFLNSGLVMAMTSEEELAGILTHEIAHVSSRHISQKIERSQKIALGTLVGLVAGLFLGGAMAGGVVSSSVAAGQSLALAYSREDEMQADQLGLKYLSEAGYSGRGLMTILKKIRDRQIYGPNEIPTYLMTHPAVDDRIAYIDGRLENVQRSAPDDGGYDFQKARIRMSALYGDAEQALIHFKRAAESTPGDPLTHYGYALALDRNGHRATAVEQLKKALARKAFDTDMLIDLGILYYKSGRMDEALKTLQEAVSAGPFNAHGYFYLGRVQLDLGMPAAAEANFSFLLGKNWPDPQVMYYIAEAYDKTGRQGLSHYYLGRFYRREGNPKNAVFHLERARATLSDPEKLKEIENTLKEIREMPAPKKTDE